MKDPIKRIKKLSVDVTTIVSSLVALKITHLYPHFISSCSDRVEHQSVTLSQSSEWTEINLDNSSPEEDIPYRKLEISIEKPRLSRQKTLPNPKLENEYSSLKSKIKLDTSLSNWISRSSAKKDDPLLNISKYFFNRIIFKILENLSYY